MKLDQKEFKRFKELEKLVKSKKASSQEKQEYEDLLVKKGSGNDSNKKEVKFLPGNDFSWWNKIPELVRDSASFKCNWIPGTAIAPGVVDEEGIGVVEIKLDSLLGSSTNFTDPVNVWARDLYLRMFQKYRPVNNYTAADLGITLLAAFEAVKLIAMYERIYGVINRYSKLNVNMPTVEGNALGLTTAQVLYLQGHLSDFRYDLNFLIRKAQRLCIPKDMSIIADAISLFGYEYMDHQSIRSQIIVFHPSEYGIYSDTRVTGGSIEYTNISGLFNFTADNMCVLLDTVLNALLGSDSVQRIFADLVVWFGQDAMLGFNPVPEDYVILPVNSESILHKIHNFECCDAATYRICSWVDGSLNSNDAAYVTGKHMIYQVDDRIVTAVSLLNIPSGAAAGTFTYPLHGNAGAIVGSSAAAPIAVAGHVVDTAHNDITPDIIVEGGMWKINTTKLADSGSNLNCLSVDSSTFYKVRAVELWRVTGSGGAQVNLSTSITSAMSVAGALACIDWAPLCYHVNGSTGAIARIYGDYDNIVYVSNPDLARIQRTTILSGLHTDVKVVNK